MTDLDPTSVIIQTIERLLVEQLRSDLSQLAALSIALGIFEQHYTGTRSTHALLPDAFQARNPASSTCLATFTEDVSSSNSHLRPLFRPRQADNDSHVSLDVFGEVMGGFAA